jgi:molybdate transport system substrate-binding protein
MRVRSPSAWIAAIVAGSTLAGCRPAADPPDLLLVAAASSLRELLIASAPAFEAEHPGTKLTFDFDASSMLARKIQEGAAFGVFLSADAETMFRIRNQMEPATITPFLGNRLALMARAGAERPASSPADLAQRSGPIALAGSEVPAGRYARTWLEKNGLLLFLAPRIVNAASVRAALGLVESMAAEYAFVYATETRAAKTAQLVWTAADEVGSSIVYVAGAVAPNAAEPRPSQADQARAYIRWLSSPPFLEAAEKHGFSRLAR